MHQVCTLYIVKSGDEIPVVTCLLIQWIDVCAKYYYTIYTSIIILMCSCFFEIPCSIYTGTIQLIQKYQSPKLDEDVCYNFAKNIFLHNFFFYLAVLKVLCTFATNSCMNSEVQIHRSFSSVVNSIIKTGDYTLFSQ